MATKCRPFAPHTTSPEVALIVLDKLSKACDNLEQTIRAYGKDENSSISAYRTILMNMVRDKLLPPTLMFGFPLAPDRYKRNKSYKMALEST